MLMAATRMVDSSSAASPPPWLPVPGDHHHHHQLLHDFTAPAPSPVPSHHHLLPRAAAPAAAHRRVATTKRRPRPSRRLPTTYISADPASFRRMVHQVTGAHDLLPQPQQPPPPPPAEVLCRPAPSRAGATTCHGATNTLLLPTLDTSAFLIGAAGALARTGTGRPSDGSAAGLPAAPVPTLTAEADDNNRGSSSSSSSCGLLFPFSTLESWDHHHATLF